MELSSRVLPADRVVALYNAVMAALWLACVTRAPHALWLALAHAAGVALPWLFVRTSSATGTAWRLLRELNPLIFVAAFWIELDLVRPILALEGIDAPIAALDRLVFGEHLHEVWLPKMRAVWMSEVMHLLYYAYYPAIYLPPLALAIMARYAAIRDMTFRLTVTYLGCYVVYIAFPVDGPHFLMEPTPGAHTEGFFYGLVEMAQQIGDSRGCSFPSSHVAGATTIAILAWRWLPRWAAVILTVEAIGVLTSTTYTQHHYAIDSVAGLAWALLVNFALATPLRRILGDRGEAERPPRAVPDTAPETAS